MAAMIEGLPVQIQIQIHGCVLDETTLLRFLLLGKFKQLTQLPL